MTSINIVSQEVIKIQLVKSDTYPPPEFHAILEIVLKGESMGMLSLITPKVIIIHDVRSFYMYETREVGDYEIKEAYEKLCNEGTLK